MPTLTKDGVTITTEVPREVVRLRSQGFTEAPAAEEALAELKVDELREQLAEKQLPVTGRKADLVARLAGTEPAAVVPETSAETPATSPK